MYVQSSSGPPEPFSDGSATCNGLQPGTAGSNSGSATSIAAAAPVVTAADFLRLRPPREPRRVRFFAGGVLEEIRLKKLKLQVKDEMELIAGRIRRLDPPTTH